MSFPEHIPTDIPHRTRNLMRSQIEELVGMYGDDLDFKYYPEKFYHMYDEEIEMIYLHGESYVFNERRYLEGEKLEEFRRKADEFFKLNDDDDYYLWETIKGNTYSYRREMVESGWEE